MAGENKIKYFILLYFIYYIYISLCPCMHNVPKKKLTKMILLFTIYI